jgi:hypothetical protein
MTTDKRNLLPIGTRVKHSNPSIAASFGNTEGTLVAYFVTGLGDHPGEKIISDIFPYRVHFDPVKDGSLRDIYPQGYEGLFTEDKIEAAAPAASIFPTDDALIVGRKWLIDIKR